jgi:hypothetical protein
MHADGSSNNSSCAGEMHEAERELSAFRGAVMELFGPEQAKFSAEDWLDESVSMNGPPRSSIRDWRAITVAASTRLATRLTGEGHRRLVEARLDARLE